MLKGKKILLGITGSIAAYKIPYLIRLLKKEEAEVKVLLTRNAKDFVTPLTLSALSDNPVYIDFFKKDAGEWNSHVELGLWADLFLIAPVTANTIAKMVQGIADNLLLATYLSARCPVYFAPAMDKYIYQHFTTQENIKKLTKKGNHLIAPAKGELASGLCGEGRMNEPDNILTIIKNHFEKSKRFKNKKVMVTAGPTFEAIDPVRFIGNYSSGMMGFEIAGKAAESGAEVYLIAGPTHLNIDHPNIYRIDVVSAEEMYNAVTEIYDKTDITIMSAAVADFTPYNKESSKIKKEKNFKEIKLKPTKDILEELGKRKSKKQFLVGFALETDSELDNARKKLKNKNLDIVVLNSLKDKGAGFGTDTNKITLIDKQGKTKKYELKHKEKVAEDIIDRIFDLMS